jgi:hypothetical protein
MNLKEIHFYDPSMTSAHMQVFYIEKDRSRVKPNVKILRKDMSVYLETNSEGFKGPEIDASKKSIAVWGDSVIFGVANSWIFCDMPKYFSRWQFLNGGLEGDPFERITQRAIDKNKEITINKNIVFPGWHTVRKPERVKECCIKCIENIPGLIFCAVPTSLNDFVVEKDLSSHFTETGNLRYVFWGNLTYSISEAKALLESLKNQNSIIREMAEQHKVPLIDLYKDFETKNFDDFKIYFKDAGHPKVESYSTFSEKLYDHLKLILN